MGDAFVVLMQVHLFFPESGSLKAKRAELNSVKAHLRNRNGATVAEVDHQDTWQPPDAAAAFRSGALDAWGIWDPFFAIAEQDPAAGVLTTGEGIAASNSFCLASRPAARITGGSPGRCEGAADNVGRYLDARFPQGARVERRLASWTDLESLG